MSFASNIGGLFSVIRLSILRSVLRNKLCMELFLFLLKSLLKSTQFPIHKLLLDLCQLSFFRVQRDDEPPIFAIYFDWCSFNKTKLPKPSSFELDLWYLFVVVTALCINFKFPDVLFAMSLSSFFNRLFWV